MHVMEMENILLVMARADPSVEHHIDILQALLCQLRHEKRQLH